MLVLAQPRELLIHQLTFLDLESIDCFALVSSCARDVCNDEWLWVQKLRRDYPGVVVPSSSTYRLLIERGYPIPYVDELAQGRLRQLLKLGGSIGYLSRYVDNVDLFLYLVDEGVEVNYAVAVILTSDHDELLEKMVARRPSTKRVRRELEKMEMDEEFIDGAISRLEEHLQ